MTDIQKTAGEVMTYGGSATSVAAGLTLNEVGVIIGILTAVLGVGIQLYFGRRRDQRDRDLYELEKKRLKGDEDD